jgi:hypothetical protein
LEDTTAESLRRGSGAFDRTDKVFHELVEVLGAAVGQVVLGQGPNALIRIQLRCVRGETLQAQTRVLAKDLIQGLAFMGGGIVQKYDHRAGQVSKEMTEEDAHLLLPDVVEPKLVIEAEMVSLRTEGDCRDDGDSLAPIGVAQDRSPATRGPGLDHVGNQQESGFVDEDEVGAQPRDVFFTRGQSFCFQRSMAGSSRSTARRSGFWWLQFRLCINRPI